MDEKKQVLRRLGTTVTVAGLALSAWLASPLLPAREAAAQDQTQPDQTDQAQALGDGILNATAYQPIPAGTAFDTVVQDPSDSFRSSLETTALDRINHELVKRGYQVNNDAALVMLIGTDLIRGASKEETLEDFRGSGDTGFTYEHNLFSNTRRSLLNRPDPDTTPNTFRISLSVYDRKTGLYIWRGSIIRGTSDLTPDKASERMIPAIVAVIGQTVKNRNVPIGHQ